MDRADAHIHLFSPGYVAELPDACRRVAPDELTLYGALAERHQIRAALVVGYEGQPWAAGNNAYIAGLAARHSWVRPAAFVAHPESLDIAGLERLRAQGFVGISLYRFTLEELAALGAVDGAVWAWLERRRWLVSANGRGETWAAWGGVLGRHPALRLLASHLGLPPRRAAPPAPAQAAADLAPLLDLARFAGAHVKLSGFYALSDPGHDYPHRAAWPYAAALAEAFGARRLLWGSDFSPSLEWVSFAQTIGVLEQLPAIDEAARAQVAGGNLIALLNQVEA
jgi:predicted TIM-barrel fold metal-dependent hydrolase